MFDVENKLYDEIVCLYVGYVGIVKDVIEIIVWVEFYSSVKMIFVDRMRFIIVG